MQEEILVPSCQLDEGGFVEIPKRPGTQLHASIYRWAARYFASGRILDLGSELAVGTQLMAEANPALELVGLEINWAALSASREFTTYDSLPSVQADGSHLPFVSESFAGICVIHTLHLVDDPARVLREAKRVLQPNGLLILSIPLLQLPMRWKPDSFIVTIHELLAEFFQRIQIQNRLIDESTGQSWDGLRDRGLFLCVAR